ncbi:hypothetical protein [Stenotrophomonas sp. TWI377]|uniref:hypothetical protein n=1 Tax=Stenotrophomonas sp. TWI377 TaxID=3136775 RepID=UPI00320AEE67
MPPIIISDLPQRTGRFNVTLGAVSTAFELGAALAGEMGSNVLQCFGQGQHVGGKHRIVVDGEIVSLLARDLADPDQGCLWNHDQILAHVTRGSIGGDRPAHLIEQIRKFDPSAGDLPAVRVSPPGPEALQHTRQLSAIHHDFKRMRIPPATETA